MADMFSVYNILTSTNEVMDFLAVCSTYPDANLMLLKEGCISIISIYSHGRKIAIINRLKEVSVNE